MTAERGMAEVAASAAREMDALAATMADVAQELRRWQINGEGLPPIQDLRQTVRALQGLTVRVAEIEEDTTNRARAEGSGEADNGISMRGKGERDYYDIART